MEESGGDDALLPAKRDRRREQKLKLHRGEKVPVEEMRRMVENCSGSFFPVRTNKNAFEPGKKKDRYCMKNENDFLVLCGVARCSKKKKVLLAREAVQQEIFLGPFLDDCVCPCKHRECFLLHFFFLEEHALAILASLPR